MRLPGETIRARRLARARCAVVIPARDEEARIGPCLEALARQRGIGSTAVYLCVNNSSDGTARLARAAGRDLGLALQVTEVTPLRGGVGRARRFGHLLALRGSPAAEVLLSTDADCLAAPGWLSAMRAALACAPVVLGKIEGHPDLDPALLALVQSRGALEDSYLRLSFEFERLMSGGGDEAICLNTAGGANLGLRRAAYLSVGGYRALTTGEDRDLVNRLIEAGHSAIRAPAAVVHASMRAEGRAPGGMADKIAARLAGLDQGFDTALLPLSAMLDRHLARRPAARPEPRGLTRAEVERDLPTLEACVAALRALPGPAERQGVLARVAAGEEDVERMLRAGGQPGRPGVLDAHAPG